MEGLRIYLRQTQCTRGHLFSFNPQSVVTKGILELQTVRMYLKFRDSVLQIDCLGILCIVTFFFQAESMGASISPGRWRNRSANQLSAPLVSLRLSLWGYDYTVTISKCFLLPHWVTPLGARRKITLVAQVSLLLEKSLMSAYVMEAISLVVLPTGNASGQDGRNLASSLSLNKH